MTFKDKPIKNIYHFHRFYPSTYNLNIHHLENRKHISGGKCTAAVDIS